MRVKELYPLTCCITLEASPIGEGSPEPTLLRTGSAVNFGIGSDFAGNDGTANDASGGSSSVAGILYKWTNYGKGWRSRWFTLRNDGVLSYSKSTRLDGASGDVVVIGSATANRVRRRKNVGTVHLKISWFRESKSDERRFYVFTATKTLHLRTNSKKERTAWIEALAAAAAIRQQRDNIPLLTRDLSISTERLKNRLLEGGIDEGLVKDCERIMLSEFAGVQGQFQDLYRERSDLLDTLRQLEAANTEAEGSGTINGEYRYTNLARGKYIEFSTTESSDDIERQELDEASDNDEPQFFDTNQHFYEPASAVDQMDRKIDTESNHNVERRKKLPNPIEKEKGVSLWSMIKDNIGKDLTRVCLPVYFNEPISSLQKCFEDLEYSQLLDEAYGHGKSGNSLMRILKVAAFAVSGYSSSEGRSCKPFNPLLGETYEADYPEKGVRFFSEKVSHHPTIIACHCEGKGWKFWCDTNIKSKFWGRSIQVDPAGTLHLEFDDGEIFEWSKVTTSIYNLILGNLYCDHHGTMHIQSNRGYSCKLKFKEQSLLDRNPHQVHGFVEDESERNVAQIFGKWDGSIHYAEGNGNPKDRSEALSLLWKKNEPPLDRTRYNLTSFAITLNELTPDLKEKLPPTDSRLRPDQRHLENGEFDKANAEKLRLETRQRISRKLQENGWRPRWFERDGQGTFRYAGGYWEARELRKWDSCPNIFGEISEDVNVSCEDS